MKIPFPLFIAIRYSRAKHVDRFSRLVTRLATIGIALGVMALIIVLSIMNGLEQQQKKQLLNGLPHAIMQYQGGNVNLNKALPPLPPLVEKVIPINTTEVVLQNRQQLSAGQVIGIQDWQDDPILASQSPFLGKFSQRLKEGSFQLMISTTLANKLQIFEGDKVRLLLVNNSRYTPFGRVPVQRLFTVSGVYYSPSESSQYTLFANLTDIGRLLRIPPGEIQGYRLFLQDPFKVAQLAHIKPELSSWRITDWRVQKGEFFQAIRMEKNMMGLLISLIIVVAISNIMTSLSLMVLDKQGEIAILQTQGLTKSRIWQIFILQGMLVSVIGSTIGGIFGVGITVNLNNLIHLINPLDFYLPTLLDPLQIALIIGFSLLLTLISTLYPAYRASKIEPAEALRYE